MATAAAAMVDGMVSQERTSVTSARGAGDLLWTMGVGQRATKWFPLRCELLGQRGWRRLFVWMRLVHEGSRCHEDCCGAYSDLGRVGLVRRVVYADGHHEISGGYYARTYIQVHQFKG